MTTKRTSGWFGDRQQLIAQHVLRRVAFAGVADDDEREVAATPTPAASPRSVAGAALPPLGASTARTIASRHVSVRDSAHEFQMPAAQFSVSKYQLMPQTGTVAARMAASGSPRCRPATERRRHRVAQLRASGSRVAASSAARRR